MSKPRLKEKEFKLIMKTAKKISDSLRSRMDDTVERQNLMYKAGDMFSFYLDMKVDKDIDNLVEFPDNNDEDDDE